VAGIQPAEPGYKFIRIEPHPGGGLTWVKASYECSYGKISSAWFVQDSRLAMDVEIPYGTEATIVVPGKGHIKVTGGRYHYETELSGITSTTRSER